MHYPGEKRMRRRTLNDLAALWLGGWVAFAGLFLMAGCGGGGGSETTGLTASSSSTSGTSIGSGAGEATLSWEAPTTSADGSALTDLAGFRIYYGTASPVSKAQGIDVGNTTEHTLIGFNQGTYYFAVTAYDTEGNESELSGEVNKAITGT